MFGTWIRKNIKSLAQAMYQDSTDPDNKMAIGIIGQVGLIDPLGNPITSLGGTSSGANDTHTTASGQISAVANSGGKTITLSGLPFTLLAEHVTGGSIKKIDTNGDVTNLSLTNVTVSGDIITLGDIDDFVVTDEVSVVLRATEKGFDFNQDVFKFNRENTDPDHYTDPENLVSASDIGVVNDTWIDQGAEIDCKTYKIVPLWINLTANDSTGNQVKVLSKHTSGGSDEYILDSTVTDYQKTLGDDNIKIMYPFNVEGIHYIQLQTKATSLGIVPAFMTGSNNHQPSFAVWEAVTDGSFRITLNGVAYNVDGIDFTGITDLDGVASIAQVALRAATGDNTLTIVYTVPGFIFTANDDADSSITALDTSTGTVGTDISGFPKANNIWFDAYDTDGVVTAATGTIATVTIDITKEY